MRALLCTSYDGYEALEIGQIPRPALGPNDLRIAVEAAGLNFADLLMISGRYQYKSPFPFAVCMEAAGTITEIGSAVTGFKVGDRVMTHPWRYCLAEEVVAADYLTFPMPDVMSMEVGSSFSLAYGTNYHGLVDRGRLCAGDTLLVLGAAGGVGLCAVSLGHALGAKVIAVASTEEKRALTLQHGADAAIDYGDGDLKDRVLELTEGRGVDVVYDPVGDKWTRQAIRCMAPGGRLLIVGFAAGDIAEIPSNHALIKMIEIIGVNYTRFCETYPERAKANMQAASDLCATGKVTPHLSGVYDFEDYTAAFARIENRQVTGRVVLKGPNWNT